MKVLILNGPAEAGKGTVADYIREIFTMKVCEYSSIDYIKIIARKFFGWDGVKDKAGRELLYQIKKIMIAYNDLPLRKVLNEIIKAKSQNFDVMIVDVREPDEIKKLTCSLNQADITCHTVRVVNTKAENRAIEEGLCLADQMCSDYDYDMYINNNLGIDDLKEQVKMAFRNRYHFISKG